MPRPILATIHPEALRHNLARVRELAPGSRVMAVIKANASSVRLQVVRYALTSSIVHKAMGSCRNIGQQSAP